MNEMEEFLKSVTRPISNVKSKPELAWTVSRSSINKLNNVIAQKIEQNRQERIASMFDAEGKIVK